MLTVTKLQNRPAVQSLKEARLPLERILEVKGEAIVPGLARLQLRARHLSLAWRCGGCTHDDTIAGAVIRVFLHQPVRALTP